MGQRARTLAMLLIIGCLGRELRAAPGRVWAAPRPAQAGAASARAKRFPFSTAIIKYRYAGWIKGREVVYLDDDSGRIAIQTLTERDLSGQTIRESQVRIYDGQSVFFVDRERGLVTKSKASGDMINAMLGEAYPPGATPAGHDSILGNVCDLYAGPAPGVRVCVWNGIQLRHVSPTSPGNQFKWSKEAVDVSVNVPIPSEKFRPPQGIPVMTIN